MNKYLWIIVFYLFYSNSFSQNIKTDYKFIQGVDLSSLSIVEKNGGVFFNNNKAVDVVSLFKEKSANSVRLRLWHTPQAGIYDLNYNLEMAKRIKAAGLNLLLDIFYSDTWADPAHQYKPAAWENLSFEELKDSVYQYTANVLLIFKSKNLLPNMIQLGNEINNGMLWDDGRIGTDAQWDKFSQLLQSAYNGAQSVLSPSDSVKIILQSATGGDINATRWFYDNLIDNGVDFDIIGLSYYPWWHGTLDELEANLNDAAVRYNKQIVVVETSYPWTLDWNDDTHNSVGLENQLLPGYPATPEGQKQFLLDEIEIIKNTPNNLGIGWFYWEPAYITSDVGSPRENLAMFDFNGNALPAITVFNESPTSAEEENLKFDFILEQNYPNPFNPTTTIEFTVPNVGRSVTSPYKVQLTIYNILGQQVTTLINEQKTPGNYEVQFDGSELASGFYTYRIDVDGRYISTKKMMLIK